MKRRLIALALATAAMLVPANAVMAEPEAHELPAAACNAGTMTAHSHIPETTGAGFTTPGHEAVPESEEGSGCAHGM